jgi:AraC-like DNA-binding protein
MYELMVPDPALRPFVEHYWWVRAPAEETFALRVDVYVDARADLIFNLGAPYLRTRLGHAPVSVQTSNLDAQRLFPIRIEQQGDVWVVGVRFRLGGVGAFVPSAMGELTNQTLAPSTVWGNSALALESALRGAPDARACAALLDAFLLALRTTDPAYARFVLLLDDLSQMPEPLDLRAIAARHGVSLRSTERLFARYLGVPPRTLVRVVRFQRALRSLMHAPAPPLAELAQTCGYFDQAHFVRDFRAMTGGVPRGYRGYFPPAGPSDFAPNVVAYVQDEQRPRR